MIVDMSNELRDFTYITSLYKHIESYNIMGHQIGRKIGDMLEILTMGVIYRTPELFSRLDTEGKLEGFTTAGHKVEFGFYNDLVHKQKLFASIECKCVGVEVTKSGSANRNIRALSKFDELPINFSARWLAAQQNTNFIAANIFEKSIELHAPNTENFI